MFTLIHGLKCSSEFKDDWKGEWRQKLLESVISHHEIIFVAVKMCDLTNKETHTQCHVKSQLISAKLLWCCIVSFGIKVHIYTCQVYSIKPFGSYINMTIYTFSWTMPCVESLSYSQVHACIITVLSLGGL